VVIVGTVLVPIERAHGKFNASENMRVCLIDDVEDEEQGEEGEDDEEGEKQRGRTGVEDIPLVVGAPSDRFNMGKPSKTHTHDPPPQTNNILNK
jgi:hypothetical protein